MSEPQDRVMHATMREVETGVFSAEYSGDPDPHAADAERYQDKHIGTDAQGLRAWVEEMARGIGFARVEWRELPPQT